MLLKETSHFYWVWTIFHDRTTAKPTGNELKLEFVLNKINSLCLQI